MTDIHQLDLAPMSVVFYPMAIGLLNRVKAWRDSEGNEAFPDDLRQRIDALLMAHEVRTAEHWKPAMRHPKDGSPR